MATKKMKINFKMPTPTAAERLHAQQQKNRKAAGLPDPSEYKKKLDAMKSENYEEDDGPLSQEQLNEISAQLKASYVSGAKKQIKQSMPFTKKSDEYRDIAKNFIAKRQKGIAKANEEVEQLDEYESKGGVYKHTAKLASSHSYGGEPRKLHDPGSVLHKSQVSRDDKTFDIKWGNGALSKAQSKKTLMNVHKNLPEEVELLDEMPESNMKVRDVHSHLKKAGWELARSKGGHDVFKHPKAKHSIPVPRHALKAPLVRGILKASKVQEQLEKKGRFVSGPIKQPFKSNTIVTSVKEAKDSHEYDYEGEMALNQLDTIMRHAEYLKDMIKPDTNLPEWVQAKITLATDYIQTSCDYLTSEMNEEVKKNEYHISKKHKFPTPNEHAVTVKHTESGREHVHSGKGKYLSKLIKTRYNINHHFEEVEHNDVEQLDEVNVGDKVSFDHPMTAIPGKTMKKIGTVHKIEGDTAHLKSSTKYGTLRYTKKMSELKKEEVEIDEMVVVKTNKPIGTRVADIGPGGKEYNVKTDKAYDDAKKKQPQGAEFAAQRRKERLATNGRMDEGRASQRHPLEGHEYHKKSNEALVHIAKDAHAAAEAMKSHNPQAENKYRDQANDSATVRYFRQKNGMPDWYKKKYGHVKEEVEMAEDADPCWKGYKMVGFKNKNGRKVPNCVPGEGVPAMKKESAEDPSEGEMKDKQSYSRKAQIVRNAAGKGKKSDNPDKFQKDPELSSEIHKT
jgi:predicted RNA binding protein YcfA (HicA-like mRNA interferase family)